MKIQWRPTQQNIRILAEEYAETEASWPDDWREHLFTALPDQDPRYASREGTLDILREVDFFNLETE